MWRPKKLWVTTAKTTNSKCRHFWDGKKGADLRVMVAADDGGWRAFKPLTDDFVMRPDGTLA
jgi:hypothetical protein